MIIARTPGRRVISVLGVAGALFVMARAPAHASLGPAQTVSIQLRGYNSYGTTFNAGLVYGTIQFDTNTTQYRLSVTICRQSSYTSPNVRITTNGVSSGVYSGEDGVRRPAICGGWGNSMV